MDEMVTTIIVAIIGSGFLNTLINQLITSANKKKEEDKGELQALRLIMKNTLRDLCVRYIQQGWIYDDELEDLIAMHDCYHNDLNGNGFLDQLMTKVKSLEIRGVGVR